MKALSLWEPWASLIRAGAKTYETRSWSTNYRGNLLICASKKRDKDALFFFQMSDVQKYLVRPESIRFSYQLETNNQDSKYTRVSEFSLYFGCAVAIVELQDCVPTEKINLQQIGPDESYFGNYGPGRFAWKLKMIDNSFAPFPVKGAQGLFDWE